MIVSLHEQLEREIKNAEFIAAMRTGLARFEEYRNAMPFVAGSYTRTRLMRTPQFELVAMQWAAGSVSPIHDHGDSRCWVVILEGALDVDNYERLDDCTGTRARIRPISSVTVKQGELDHRLNRRELHRVRNTGSASAFSLQVYSEPLTYYTTVDERTGECGRLDAKYEATFDL
jgi:cysteine dioxygenase